MDLVGEDVWKLTDKMKKELELLKEGQSSWHSFSTSKSENAHW